MATGRWAGLILVVAVSLAALGVALGIIAGRAGRSEASTLSLVSSIALSTGDLELWHDEAKTKPVTSLQFSGVSAKAPIRPWVEIETVFIHNLTTADLFLVHPCGGLVDSVSTTAIGTIDAAVHDLKGNFMGNTCDFPPTVVVSADHTVRADLHIELIQGLASADYAFQTRFEANDSVSKIAFRSFRHGDYEIYLMNADGSNQTRLTNSTGNDSRPHWSPDGSKIAFLSGRDGNPEIYVMTSAGGNQTRLTDNSAADDAPVWSPDGSKIAFQSNRDGNPEIYVMTSAGGNQTRLTDNSAADDAPVWSPDGSKIAFQSNRDGNPEIYVMTSAGGNQTRLTVNSGEDQLPAWSPDGSKIAFQFESGPGAPLEVYVMNADGSGQTRLTINTSRDDVAAWSPAFSLPLPKPVAIQPPAGMISWWSADGHTTDIVDGNHGILSGDATYSTEGKVGAAFSFDGTGDFVLVPDSPSLNITGDVTVDLWARRTSFGSTNAYMAMKGGVTGQSAGTMAYALYFDHTHRLLGGFKRGDGSFVTLEGPKVTDTGFHHYAYVRSGQTHRLFVDGVPVTADSFTGTPGDTSGLPMAIGALRSDSPSSKFIFHFGGVIDEVEIFNRALSAAEIRAIYNAGSAGKIKPVAVAGDVNGDGKADFIVGARRDDPAGGGLDAGSAYVFSGADGSLLYHRTGDAAQDIFGWSVGGAQ